MAAILLAAVLVILLRSVHGSPEKRERKRRIEVHRHGRLGDALITDADAGFIYYQYSVRGVHYAASQDISALRDRLPARLERLIGMAHLKYAPRNPANSILLCEEWSGLREPARMANAASAQGAAGKLTS